MMIPRFVVSFAARVVIVCIAIVFIAGCSNTNLSVSQLTTTLESSPLIPSASPTVVPVNTPSPLAKETDTPAPGKQATLTPTSTSLPHYTWQGPLLALYAGRTLVLDFGTNQLVPIDVGWPVLGWSPDGCYLVGDRSSIVNIGTLQGKTLLTSPSVGGTILKLAWAPTAEWIAYTGQSQSGSPQGIFVVHPDGTQKKPLAASSALAGWSSDGQEVLFWSAHNSITSLYAINVSTSITREIVQLPATADFIPEITLSGTLRAEIFPGPLSPDQRWAVIMPYLENQAGWSHKLYLLNIQTGQIRSLHDKWFGLNGVAWSPDSKKIAFGATFFDEPTADKSSLYLMDIPSGRSLVLATSTNEDYVMGYPSWSPDGKKLAFLGLPSPWLYDLETKKLTKLLPEATLKTDVSWYSPMLWSPKSEYKPGDCQ
jgi:Tol biopolymer transport system component